MRALARAGPIWGVLVVAVVFGAFVLAKLAVHHFDPSYFVMTNEAFCDVRATPPELTVPTKDQGGFDGQFYYRIALAPTSFRALDHGIRIDLPSQRHQRILYPAVAHVLALGKSQLVLWTLIGANFGAALVLAWLACSLSQSSGWAALMGLVVPLYAGFVFSLARDLTEIFAATFLVAAILALRREKRGLAPLWMSLAILSRETTLIFAGAVLFADARAVLKREKKIHQLIPSLVPIGVYLTWQAWLAHAYGQLSVVNNKHSLSAVPLLGFLRFFRDAVRHLYVLDGVHVALMIAFAIVVARRLREAAALFHERLAWVGYVTLILMCQYYFWEDMANYLRSSFEFFVLGIVILLGSPKTKVQPAVWALASAITLLHLIASSDLIPNMY